MTKEEILNKLDILLRELIFESWMSERDYDIILNHIFTTINKNKLDMVNDIIIGINNGYSVGDQFKIVKKFIKQLI